MADDRKIPTYKPKPNLQIEVVPLQSLIQAQKEYLVKPHRTDFYHIFLFEDCRPKHWVDFEPIEIKPFSLLFIDNYRVHQFDKTSNYDGQLLIFNEDVFSSTNGDLKFLKRNVLFNGFSEQTLIELTKDDFDKFKTICKSINRELTIQNAFSQQIFLKNLLQNFLILAEREVEKHSPPKKGSDLDYTLLFRDLLEKHFIEFKSVSYYSTLIHITEKRLRQATSNILGKPPKEVISDRVILEAKRLLVHTTLSIKEIGQELGFEDSAYFVRFFKRSASITPIDFRNTHLD